MSCSEGIAPDLEEQGDLAETVRTLILHAGDPSRVLEFYYWSQEPGLLECVRAILAMPNDARAALLAFLSATSMGQEITATFDQEGGLNLHSPDAEDVPSSLLSCPSFLQN